MKSTTASSIWVCMCPCIRALAWACPIERDKMLHKRVNRKRITKAWGVMNVEFSETNRNMNNQDSLSQIGQTNKKIVWNYWIYDVQTNCESLQTILKFKFQILQGSFDDSFWPLYKGWKKQGYVISL